MGRKMVPISELWVCVRVRIYIYVHIHIHIYIERERKRGYIEPFGLGHLGSTEVTLDD